MNKKMTLEAAWTQSWYLKKAIKEIEEGAPYSQIKDELEENLRWAQKVLHIAQTTAGDQKPIEIDEPERPSPSEPGKRLLWHPMADRTVTHKTQGKIQGGKGLTRGLVVHFTAGRCDTEADAVGTMRWGKDMGYAFWGMGPTGKLYQSHALDTWGHHAGVSAWPGLGTSVSRFMHGIEIACAGKVDSSGKSWFGVTYDKSRTRTVKAKDNIQSGNYVKYTEAQEKALIDLCLWLKRNDPEGFDFDLVLGHDQVCSPKGRKSDPGGSLSMTMPELQKRLKELWAKELEMRSKA